MKGAIITGATGAIGSALVKELIKNNIQVLVLCRRNSERVLNIPKSDLVKIQYCNLEELKEINNDTCVNYDVFYHFAWMGTTGTARDDMYLQNKNIEYSLDAVRAAKRFGCHTFIGAGSQAEYGRSSEKLTANTAPFPETGYGYAKLCAGQMTRDFAHELGMKHIWTRILSIYGPNDTDKSMVMSAIQKLKRGIVPEFTKAEQIWDYLYSGDAAKAFRLLGEKGVDGRIYVLGSGKPRVLREYIEEIRDVVSPEMELGIGCIEYSNKTVMYLCADTSELEKDCQWMAETEFKSGIKKILGESENV